MYLLDNAEADNILGEIVLGEEEEIVDIEYFTPVDSLLIPNDSILMLNDSLGVLNDSVMIDADTVAIDSLQVRS
jgi:hypothetical protein